MPIIYTSEGTLIVLNLLGKLKKEEVEVAQEKGEEMMQTSGKVNILILLKGFLGWEDSYEWGDLSFAMRNDRNIKKMAIVGDPQWKDAVFDFTVEGLRPFPMEFFAADQEEAARQWLKNI